MNITDKVALVTGASRGVGKAVALGLAEAGATVYLTTRTLKKGHGPISGSLSQAIKEIKALSWRPAFPLRCDHSNDEEVKAIFERIIRKEK